VTFQSELFSPNLISLEFNSPLFLYSISSPLQLTLEVSLQRTTKPVFYQHTLHFQA